MALTWWLVAIAGMVALAACVAVALLSPSTRERRQLRPLANVGRLTALPEYARALRRQTLAAAVAIIMLSAAFIAAVTVTARPSGLPALAESSSRLPPQDIMVCIGDPLTDAAARAALRYFADNVTSLGTERIGLTSANRRVIPLTRDYQYAAAQFAGYARPVDQQTDARAFTAPVDYADYAASVEDVLALCLTGFPDPGDGTAARRSVIYVGPASLVRPGDGRSSLFSAARVEELASSAGVQVNALITGGGGQRLEELARRTGGTSYPAESSVAAHLAAIMQHPPAAERTQETAARSVETPDVPVLLGLLALTVLTLWPVVVRR